MASLVSARCVSPRRVVPAPAPGSPARRGIRPIRSTASSAAEGEDRRLCRRREATAPSVRSTPNTASRSAAGRGRTPPRQSCCLGPATGARGLPFGAIPRSVLAAAPRTRGRRAAGCRAREALRPMGRRRAGRAPGGAARCRSPRRGLQTGVCGAWHVATATAPPLTDIVAPRCARRWSWLRRRRGSRSTLSESSAFATGT
mmetsp:Transcript_41406/g.129036  ORF Transcript_41406/g.129036 Transcript_41406/m.129036 type:complete len:201 (+) Transcript_41406:364-966(+)